MLDSVSDLLFGPVFDTVDIGLVVIDGDGLVVAWNDWIARISRRPAHQVLGQPFFEIFPDAHNSRMPGVIADAFQAGSSSILTHTLNALLPLQGEGGEPLYHNIVVRPVSSVQANYCLLQITDVTVAVTRERVLRERQNARYHAIVDSAPDAIITIDNNGNIQWVNGSVDHVLGYGHSELLGQKLDILLDPDSPLWSALAQSSTGQKNDAAISVVARYKNGKSGHFDISLGHWRADQRDFVTTIWRDVTERVAADAALRDARDALQKSNDELESRVEERTRERETALRQLPFGTAPNGSLEVG
jgi:PAS domain S-box-containing protein